jgi:hypothetical protein
MGRVPGSKSSNAVKNVSICLVYGAHIFHLDIPDLVELYQDRVIQAVKSYTVNSAKYYTHGISFDTA